jgi:hypothetical protein
LVACEFSGTVRRAFADRGHDAWSCDLLPADDGSPRHIVGDARELLGDGWDMLIAHPPCTRLCNSGVRWLSERDLWADMREGAALFLAFLNAPIPRVAVENPVMHGHARAIIGRGPDFTTQPWQHGDPFVKRTCFWTRGLPPLTPSRIVAGREAAVHRASPGPDRWKVRSVTYPGIAAAMASQWGDAAHASDDLRALFEAAWCEEAL